MLKTEKRTVLNSKEAAELLTISVQALYQMVAKKTVPHHRLGTKLVFNRYELLSLVGGEPVDSDPVVDWLLEKIEERRRTKWLETSGANTTTAPLSRGEKNAR